MERERGLSLWCISFRMEEGAVKRISWQILQGVDYCHRNGVSAGRPLSLVLLTHTHLLYRVSHKPLPSPPPPPPPPPPPGLPPT